MEETQGYEPQFDGTTASVPPGQFGAAPPPVPNVPQATYVAVNSAGKAYGPEATTPWEECAQWQQHRRSDAGWVWNQAGRETQSWSSTPDWPDHQCNTGQAAAPRSVEDESGWGYEPHGNRWWSAGWWY